MVGMIRNWLMALIREAVREELLCTNPCRYGLIKSGTGPLKPKPPAAPSAPPPDTSFEAMQARAIAEMEKPNDQADA